MRAETKTETIPKSTVDLNPPVLILGGSANTLSIARSLGKRGIEVMISVRRGSPAQFSRYVSGIFTFERQDDPAKYWARLLLENPPARLRGAVLLACNDEAVEFVAKNRSRLDKHFLLDDAEPELQLTLLDKRKTIDLAREAGIPAPGYWQVNSEEDLAAIAGEASYPAMIKPIHSHQFRSVFGKKLFHVFDAAQLLQLGAKALRKNLRIMVTEWIPGPDHLLGSYYTYLDSQGQPLFHYTKKVVRRFPSNQGLACCHLTEWDEEIAELGLRFFQAIGLRGLGNVEFKRDLRDGKLKIIECNPRFTAAQELLTRSGMDIARIIYDHMVGRPLQRPESYRQRMLYWYPVRDLRAFWELRRRGEISLIGWLQSLRGPRVYPYFNWNDPLPSLMLWKTGLME